MIAVAFKLLIDAVNSIITDRHLIFSPYLVLVCIITITVKFSLYMYTNRLNKKFKNILLKANAKDHRNDCFVTSFTLISILLSMKNIYFVDGIVGIGIALWICYTGVKIFIESYNILMDVSIDQHTKDVILDLIHNYKEIKKIENLYSTPSGYKHIVILTIFVDGSMSTFESHSLANSLEQDISFLDNVSNVIIHVNPI